MCICMSLYGYVYPSVGTHRGQWLQIPSTAAIGRCEPPDKFQEPNPGPLHTPNCWGISPVQTSEKLRNIFIVLQKLRSRQIMGS